MRVDLDLYNIGEEKVKLTSLQITDLALETEGLEEYRREFLLPRLSRYLTSPYDINGRDYVSIRIVFKLLWVDRFTYSKDLCAFARFLNSLGQYHVTLEYTYKDMDLETHAEAMTIEGSYADLKTGAVEQWRKQKQDLSEPINILLNPAR